MCSAVLRVVLCGYDERRRRSWIPLSSGLIRKRVWHTAARSRRPLRRTSKGRARVPVGVVRGGPFGGIPRAGTAAPAHVTAAAAAARPPASPHATRRLPHARTPTPPPTPRCSSSRLSCKCDHYRIIHNKLCY